MITIISGTNRKGSATLAFAKYYYETLKSKTTEEVKLLSLADLPADICHIDMYAPAGQSKGLAKLQDEYMLPANKFVVLSPEYNGSFPGVLKLFLDACSIREYKANFVGKTVALVGISSGRAGNLRGLDHLSSVFNHVGTRVLPNKLPISNIKALLSEDNELVDEGTKEAIGKQIEAMLAV